MRLMRWGSIQILVAVLLLCGCSETSVSYPKYSTKLLWQSDLQNGYYQNPILHIDYSDPDVVAVGDEFYMTASSFNAAPGLPILYSTDLVNWQLINYALPQQVPHHRYSVPQHGNGVWAPTLRYHEGTFWIFYPDPDQGIFVIHTQNPREAWSEPKLILPGKGIIDPAPLWDDNGQAWLVHAWAKSRAGFNNVLSLRKMAWDASSVEAEYVNVVNGDALPGYRTIEGPKFYRRNGFYYIFAPAGGVEQGWQTVFRSKHISGPYEEKIVMHQGNTMINGPHQGAWVHTSHNEDWFVHFQSRKAYGRIVHLQPMEWVNDWPVIGVSKLQAGAGEPVIYYRKPKTSQPMPLLPQPTSDEFDGTLGLQWQWNANPTPQWYRLEQSDQQLQLFTMPQVNRTGDNLWMTPSLLLQKVPAETFEVRTLVDITALNNGRSGLLVFGEDYAWVGIEAQDDVKSVVFSQCKGARIGCDESRHKVAIMEQSQVELRLVYQPGNTVIFSYRTNLDKPFVVVGEQFKATRGRWVGAKIGLFAVSDSEDIDPLKRQFTALDYVRFSPLGIHTQELPWESK